MSTASHEYKSLAGRSKEELERIFRAGETPSVEGILGFEYRGYNHPRMMSLLGIRKFIKGFFKSELGETFGCNTPVVQNELDGEWVCKGDDARPKRFGFFRVAPVDPESKDNEYLHSLLLDYGRGGNPIYDPSKVIRDYLVRVEPGSDDLLLGKAYLALGPMRPASNFFLLERHRPMYVEPKITHR